MLDRRDTMKRAMLGGALLGSLSMLFVAVLEISFCAVRGGLVNGSFSQKLTWAAAAAGVLLAVGPFAGAALGALSAAVDMLAAKLARRRVQEPAWAARIYTLIFALPVALFCVEVFKGRKLAALPLRDLWALGMGGFLLGAVYLATRLLLSFRERLILHRSSRLEAWGGLALLAFASFSALLLDRLVWPGLYPHLHAALTAFVLLAAFLAAYVGYLRLRRRLREIWVWALKPRGVGIVTFVLLLAGTISLVHLGRSQRRRSFAFRRTAVVSKVLRVLHGVGVLPAPRAVRALPPPPDKVPPRLGPRRLGADLLIISVDALRADQVGLCGGSSGITPNIDRIFKNGAVFTRAYTPMPQTSYALVSLMTGRYMSSFEKVRSESRYPSLADTVRRFGYKAAAFIPPAVFYIDRKFFTIYEKSGLGFEHVDIQYYKTKVDDDAKVRTDRVIEFIKSFLADKEAGKERAANLLVWVHYFDPHHPYQPRDGFDLGSSGFKRYKGEIAYVDREVARLHDAFVKARPGSIVLLTGDHGEAFGEHDSSAHGTTLYEEQVRVPLLIVGPGIPRKTIESPVELVDVAPTALTLLDLPVPAAMQGTDLTPYMGGAPLSTLPPAFAEVHSPGGRLAMVAHGSYKLIKDLRTETLELYDLAADPRELKPLDIDGEEGARKKTATLLGYLNRWRAEGNVVAGGKEKTQGSKEPRPERDMESPDIEERRLAAASMMRRPKDPSKKDLLVRHMEKDQDPEVRHRCTVLAARLQVVPALDGAEKLLERPDLPVDMRRMAALALAEAGRISAVESLIDVYRNTKSFTVRREIIKALGRLSARPAVPLLMGALKEAGTELAAAEALGRIRDPGSVDPLLALLDAPSAQALTRQAAVKALSSIGGDHVVSALLARVERHSEPLVRATMLLVLSREDALPGKGRIGWKAMKLARKQMTCTEAGRCTPTSTFMLKIPLPEIGSLRPSDSGNSADGSKALRGEALGPEEEQGGFELWIMSEGRSSDLPELVISGQPLRLRSFYEGRAVRLMIGARSKRLVLRITSWPDGLSMRNIVLLPPGSGR